MPNRPRTTIFRLMTTQAVHEPPTLALTVNGERRSVSPNTTLAGFLAELSLDPRVVVVELNRTILRDRETYDTVTLCENDVLEIVHFVGGG